MDGFGRSLVCNNLDECEIGSHNCHASAVCSDTVGSFECACLNGFTGNGTSCVDTDECQQEGFCGDNSICFNIIGGANCVCEDGYSEDSSGNCADLDECDIGDFSCTENSECKNTEGSYTCECAAGYTANGDACEDIDECNPASGFNMLEICDAGNAICINLPGTVECKCKDGYASDENGDCSDVDECIDVEGTCSTMQTCTNTIGSFECGCNDGWIIFDGINEPFCAEIDECAHENFNNCDTNALCTNTEGSYTCECLDGFTGDGTEGNCTDSAITEGVDECAEGTHDCDLSTTVCEDTEDSFICNCKPRYVPTSEANTCTFDLDSCDARADLGVAWKGRGSRLELIHEKT